MKPETKWEPKTKEEAITFEQEKAKAKEREAKPSDFDKKWAKAERIAKDKGGGTATAEQIADTYKAKFGTAGLAEALLSALGGGTETPEKSKGSIKGETHKAEEKKKIAAEIQSMKKEGYSLESIKAGLKSAGYNPDEYKEYLK